MTGKYDHLTSEELLDLFCKRTGVSRLDADQTGELSTNLIRIISQQYDPDGVARVVCGAIRAIVSSRAPKVEA